MKILFLDIETTGFDRRWDYIIEVAAILYDTETNKELSKFHEYIKPGKSISEEITELTGISNYQVRNCRSEDDVLRDFIEYITISKPDKLCAHNGDNFDFNFIRAKSNFYFFDLGYYETIDTLKIARKLKPNVTDLTASGRPSYKQTSLAKFYGIEYDAHSAIEDVKALIEIYKKMGTKESESLSTKRRKLGF